MIAVLISISIAACVMAQGESAVDVASASVVPAPPSLSGSPASLEAQRPPISRAEARRLRKEMRAASAANVDVAYPFGGVVVRRGNDGGRNVNVVYPGGRVNVGGSNANVAEGGRPAVNVEYPGGSVRLQPSQPGGRRKGVIEFPFGRVVLS